ncbi:hypothetical protein V8C86DRAFT_2859138 [Haematococcus lacustris]
MSLHVDVSGLPLLSFLSSSMTSNVTGLYMCPCWGMGGLAWLPGWTTHWLMLVRYTMVIGAASTWPNTLATVSTLKPETSSDTASA